MTSSTQRTADFGYMRQRLALDYYEQESWRCCTESQRQELEDAAFRWSRSLLPELVLEYFQDLLAEYTA